MCVKTVYTLTLGNFKRENYDYPWLTAGFRGNLLSDKSMSGLFQWNFARDIPGMYNPEIEARTCNANNTWSIWGADTVSMWVFGIINSPVVRTVFSRWIVVKVNLGGFQLVSNLFANGGLSTEQSHTVNSLDTICSCACFIDNHWGAK